MQERVGTNACRLLRKDQVLKASARDVTGMTRSGVGGHLVRGLLQQRRCVIVLDPAKPWFEVEQGGRQPDLPDSATEPVRSFRNYAADELARSA